MDYRKERSADIDDITQKNHFVVNDIADGDDTDLIRKHLQILKFLIVILFICVISTIAIGVISVVYVIIPRKVVSDYYSGKKITIEATDGITLTAYEKGTDAPGHNWALLIHSYKSDHTFMNPYSKGYLEAGYHVIQPDNRAHGESGGMFIGMGFLDQYDILCWINYIIDKDPDAKIVLHGVSMGAAALMMLSGQEGLPDNIVAIIEDCGYKSARDYLTWKLEHKIHIPAFPIIPIANVAFKIAAGYYMYDASAIDNIKNSNIPILFIHGEDDQTVPVSDAYELFNAAGRKKDIYIVQKAGHGESIGKDEIRYWKVVFSFIDKQR